MKYFYSVFFLLIVCFSLSAQNIAHDYYIQRSDIEGSKGAVLKTALFHLISQHYNVGYGGLYNVYKTSDNKGNNKVWDMYSTCDFMHGNNPGGNASVCSGYNREHMIPQSWFEGNARAGEMKSDAFHVYPTDCKVNGLRSNYPHGETNADPLSVNYGQNALGKLGGCIIPGYSGTIYEPDDQYKGDIARTYFYFVTCYEGFSSSHTNGRNVISGGAYPGLTNWFLKLMLKWHHQDPVSKKEIDRNNAVYVHQHNRNPYIDYPALVEYVWEYTDKHASADDVFFYSKQPSESGSSNPTVVISVSGQTINIQGLNKTELIQVVDATGYVVYEETTTCTNHNIEVPYPSQYKVKINGAVVGNILDIK